MARIIVTGAAGFIGFFVAKRLVERGDEVIGVDALTPYYDVSLKEARLALLRQERGFRFERVDLADKTTTQRLFGDVKPTSVIHLAAQPGVRHSLQDPHAYVDANVTGFLNVLEGCRHNPVHHLVYASSSSVYGGNTKVPFSVEDNVDHPVSLYAATKKANELMAHTYSHLFGIPATGLRLFTVYGPWGRPDMAPMLFTKAIIEGRPIQVFNHGNMKRDFTYVDDIVEGILRVHERPPGEPGKVFNVGNNTPVDLMQFISTLEQLLGKTVEKQMLPMQPGDVPVTFADVSELERDIGFRPQTSLEDGLRHFVRWYREFYRV